mgnify:CR=1 FL=1
MCPPTPILASSIRAGVPWFGRKGRGRPQRGGGIPGVVSLLLFRENVVDIDVEEHGAHGTALTQATLQWEGLRDAVTDSDAHYRVGVEFADEVVYPPVDAIEA